MTLRQQLDKLFRGYLLRRAERNSHGQIFCPLTKKWYDEKYIDVCHFIDRQFIGTRYSEENCILCSSHDNRNNERHLERFKEYLGDRVEHLHSIKENKLSISELEELKNKFKDE